MMESKFNKDDIVGRKVNNLLIIKYSHFTRNAKDRKPRHLYRCKCDCGKEILKGRASLLFGKVKGCGCINWLRWGNKNGETHFKSLYKSYIKSAKKRKISFNLIEKDFRDITKRDCFYCGVKPSQKSITTGCKGYYLYNGIDRKNSKLGYTIDNCVPCCKWCNFAKLDSTIENFKKHINKIYKHFARFPMEL